MTGTAILLTLYINLTARNATAMSVIQSFVLVCGIGVVVAIVSTHALGFAVAFGGLAAYINQVMLQKSYVSVVSLTMLMVQDRIGPFAATSATVLALAVSAWAAGLSRRRIWLILLVVFAVVVSVPTRWPDVI